MTRLHNITAMVNCVYFGKIGYAGEENEVYDSYQRFLEIAPDSMWVKLSYNKNPILRIYAFDELDTRKSLCLQDVKKRLQKDEATVCHVFADTRMSYSVSFLFRIRNRSVGVHKLR